MKRTPTHTIRHTYLDRHGVAKTRVNCELQGANDDEARQMFGQHVRHAEDAWKTGRTWNGVPVRILGIQLVDANGTEVAAWTHKVEGMVA